jgi:hypothetical protein
MKKDPKTKALIGSAIFFTLSLIVGALIRGK